MLGKEYADQDCAMARALETVGERWTLLIVRDAFYGVQRFNDFQAHLDIPKGVLSDRLAGLVEEGVITRSPDPAHGGRHLYALSESGRDLWPVVHGLLAWGDRHRERQSRVFFHTVCETSLEPSGACATCGVIPGPEDVSSRPARGRRSRPRREDPVAVALREPRPLLVPLDAS